METRPKRLFLTVLPQNILVPSQQSLAFFLQENPPLLLKDRQVLWQVLAVLLRDGGVEEEEAGNLVLELLVPGHLLEQFLLNRCLLLFVWASLSSAVWCRSL